jgi:hypothetical protein
VRSGTTWTQQQKLTASDGAATDNFGSSVALSGDTALVGASGDDVGGNANQGSAYVFVRTGTTWTQQQQLTASDGTTGDNFCISVALEGDTAVIGAGADDINGNADQGSAYVFVRTGTIWAQQQKLFAADGAANDFFGYSVALNGGTALVGAYLDDIGGNVDQGSAYIFGMNCPVITLSPATLPAEMAGNPYSQTLTGSGGAPSYSFAITAGALPNGVTLSGGGLLSGTPTTFGPFNFTVRATDNNGCQGTQAYALTINPPCSTITLSPATLPNGAVGTAYNQTATATGGTPAYTFSISAGTLPGGVNLASGGALTGMPNAGGTFNFTIKATDANGCFGSRTYIMNIATCAVTSLTPTSQAVTGAGGSFNFTVTAPGCAWSTLSNAPWLTVMVNPTGTGNLVVGYSAAANSGAARTGLITVNNQVFTVTQEAGAANTGLQFYPLPRPVRLMDTRANQGNCDNVSTPIAAGTSLTTLARTTCEGVTIPANAQAIVGNLTVINQSAQAGYLTIYPDGVPVPLASNMIYYPGQIIANNFTVALSSDGKFNVFGERTIDVVLDISGYFAPPGAGGLYYHPLAKPIRLLDTRPNEGNCDNISTPVAGGSSLTTQARITCEGLTIPSTAQALAANATVINVSGQTGYLTIYPNGVPVPLASNIIYFPGQIISNAFTVSLDASGKFNIFGERTIDMVVDVAGYYSAESADVNGAGLLFTPLARPLRILDTRANQGNCDNVITPIAGGTSIATLGRLTCEGLTIPPAAQSVLGNVTVINQTSQAGYLTLFPDGVPAPLVSNMVYFPSQLLANAFIVGVNAGTGQFRLFAERALDAVVDVSGYFAP